MFDATKPDSVDRSGMPALRWFGEDVPFSQYKRLVRRYQHGLWRNLVALAWLLFNGLVLYHIWRQAAP